MARAILIFYESQVPYKPTILRKMNEKLKNYKIAAREIYIIYFAAEC